MEEPGSFTIAIRVLLLFMSAIALPQIAGVVSLRSAWRKNKKIILIPALFVAPVFFFVESVWYWRIQAAAIRAEGGYACGAFGAAAYFSSVRGTALHLCLSGAILFFMWFAAKRRGGLLGE